MWKRSLRFLSFLFIILTAFSCGGLDQSQVQLNEEFYLSIGQSAFIAGENLGVRFKDVTEDSRCPRDVTCVWAGRVTCVIELTHEGSSYQMSLTESGLTDEYARERYEWYEFTFHVTPYPEAGNDIPSEKYHLHLIVSKLSESTKIIGSIIAEPFAFEGQDIIVTGYYRGWDLLHEANTSPPVTRSDWVIKDATGAIYVSAASTSEIPEGLEPSSLQDTSIILKVKGIVRVTKGGQPYIEATGIERVP